MTTTWDLDKTLESPFAPIDSVRLPFEHAAPAPGPPGRIRFTTRSVTSTERTVDAAYVSIYAIAREWYGSDKWTQLITAANPRVNFKKKIPLGTKLRVPAAVLPEEALTPSDLVGGTPVTMGDPLIVPFGQVTFNAEGNDTPDNPYYSRKPHRPDSKSSGVTVGRGYDLGQHKREQIVADLTQAGVSREYAAKLSAAAEKKDTDADTFKKDFTSANPTFELSREQQWTLFVWEYMRQANEAARLLALWENARPGATAMDIESLDATTIELLVDLKFRGDLVQGAWDLLRPAVNNRAALAAVMQKKSNWSAVPPDRYRARCDYLGVPADKEVGWELEFEPAFEQLAGAQQRQEAAGAFEQFGSQGARTYAVADYVSLVRKVEAAYPRWTPDEVLNALRRAAGYDTTLFRIMYGTSEATPIKAGDGGLGEDDLRDLEAMSSHRGGVVEKGVAIDPLGQKVAVGHVLCGLSAGEHRNVTVGMAGGWLVGAALQHVAGLTLDNLYATTIAGDLGQSAVLVHLGRRSRLLGAQSEATDAELIGDIDGCVLASNGALRGRRVSDVLARYYWAAPAAQGDVHAANRFRLFASHLTGSVLQDQTTRFARAFFIKEDLRRGSTESAAGEVAQVLSQFRAWCGQKLAAETARPAGVQPEEGAGMTTTWNLEEMFESPFATQPETSYAEMPGATYTETPQPYAEMPQPYGWLPEAPVPGMPAERMPLAHESPQPVSDRMVRAGGLWVPGAERVANAKSSGGSYVDGPWRFVFHTVEGEPSEAGFRRLAAEHTNPPHLWAMPSANLLLQTIPLDRSAYALARPGSVHTNRRRAIQVEVVGFAAKMGNLGPREIEWLADRLLAPVARLVPINLEHVRPTGDDTACYGERSGCRMTPEEWERFDGVCGHQHVPDNKHWDPGRMRLDAIAARARQTIRGGGQPAREQLADHDGPNFAAERDEDEFESWASGFEYDTPPPATTYAPPPPGPPPAPPNPPLSGPVPVKRNCCLLDPKSLKDLSTMGTYSTYGAVNSGNPGIVYTSKAGFVDLGHLFTFADVTAYAYQQIYAAKGAAGTTIKTAYGTAKIDLAIPNTHWLEYARKIAYDDSVAYEIATSKGASSFLPGNLNSSFSPEDLCSNYLGTVVTANALNTPSAMSFPGRVDSEVRKLLAFLGVQSNVEAGKAFALKNNIWIAWNNDASGLNPYYLRRRNFTEKPWLAGHPKDQPGAWTPVPFPSMLLYTYRHSSGFTDRDFYKEISIFRTWAQATFGVDYDKP